MLVSNDQETDNIEIGREISENLGSKPQVLTDKKLIKEEVKSRLVSGIQTAALEYDSLYNEEKATLNKDCVLLSLLFHRMFFYKLNDMLSGLSCDHTLRLTKQILTQMQFKRGKINEIIDVFKKNGGQCDCEILYNVESQLIGK